MKSAGLGCAVSIGCNCTGCVSQAAVLEMSAKYELDNTTEVSISNAGCFYRCRFHPHDLVQNTEACARN